MTVFVWKPAPFAADKADHDEFSTAWAFHDPVCMFCGLPLTSGEKVMAWHGVGVFTVHAACMAKSASGFLRDIAECMK